MLIVIDIAPPYDADLARVMACPPGSEVRLQQSVSKTVGWSPGEAMLGHVVIVVARRVGTGWLLPIRSGTIASLRRVGDTVFVGLRLAAMTALSEDPVKREQQLTEFNNELMSVSRTHLKVGGVSLGSYMIANGNAAEALLRGWQRENPDDEISRWGIIVSLIAEEYAGASRIFFKLSRVLTGMDEATMQNDSRDRTWAYPIKAGRFFQLEIAYTVVEDQDDRPSALGSLELASADGRIHIRRGNVPITASSDLLTYGFDVSRTARTGLVSLVLSSSGQGPARPCAIELPVRIYRNHAVSAVRITALIAFVLGIMAYLFPAAVVHFLKSPSLPSLGAAPSAMVVQKAAVLTLLLTANATGLTSWVADHFQLS